jgi:hypothetical protein
MTANGRDNEHGSKGPLKTDSGSESGKSKKHWKERLGDTLPPGNYSIDTGETDIEAAHITVENMLDDITDYHVVHTISTAYLKEIRCGNYSFTVVIRTNEPTSVTELPDSPCVRSGIC